MTMLRTTLRPMLLVAAARSRSLPPDRDSRQLNARG